LLQLRDIARATSVSASFSLIDRKSKKPRQPSLNSSG
jgi:hypothetical protein